MYYSPHCTQDVNWINWYFLSCLCSIYYILCKIFEGLSELARFSPKWSNPGLCNCWPRLFNKYFKNVVRSSIPFYVTTKLYQLRLACLQQRIIGTCRERMLQYHFGLSTPVIPLIFSLLWQFDRTSNTPYLSILMLFTQTLIDEPPFLLHPNQTIAHLG